MELRGNPVQRRTSRRCQHHTDCTSRRQCRAISSYSVYTRSLLASHTARHRIRERQWCAKLRAWPVNWDRILPPPGSLRRLVVQPGQLPPAPGELCDCCAGYYRIDDIRRFLRELAREAIVLPEDDAPVYVFLLSGPRYNPYGFREGYHDFQGPAAGDGLEGTRRSKC